MVTLGLSVVTDDHATFHISIDIGSLDLNFHVTQCTLVASTLEVQELFRHFLEKEIHWVWNMCWDETRHPFETIKLLELTSKEYFKALFVVVLFLIIRQKASSLLSPFNFPSCPSAMALMIEFSDLSPKSWISFLFDSSLNKKVENQNVAYTSTVCFISQFLDREGNTFSSTWTPRQCLQSLNWCIGTSFSSTRFCSHSFNMCYGIPPGKSQKFE
ncbi:hypothetical protein MAR_034595 [Mya arenaria]|uniref:Uncharacterized protein n=1 Tax=Mya arenaria TaxID=6604 RepID=A0ABY7EKI3_MYAAR|nr:hypothetical protein MAR_034595 [Mya arenaria]